MPDEFQVMLRGHCNACGYTTQKVSDDEECVYETRMAVGWSHYACVSRAEGLRAMRRVVSDDFGKMVPDAG